LLRREAVTVQMDHQVALDPLVLSLAKADLDAADQVLSRVIGELTEPFDVLSTFGQPSDVERLIGSAILAALRQLGVEVDVVVHGLFDEKAALSPGTKTVADAWTILPYENQITTIELAHDDLLALAQDFSGSGRDFRNLMGVQVVGSRMAGQFRLEDLRAADGSPLPVKSAYRIALNSFDSQSAGQRFPVVARLVARPSSRRILYPVQVRDALVDFFVSRRKVGTISLLV
jgi:2',3'-cyclic-nucleotide 2'-phosphodiesterase (5'-nucleotidase family)